MLNEVLLEKYFANGRKDTFDEMIVFIKCRSMHNPISKLMEMLSFEHRVALYHPLLRILEALTFQ